MSDNDNKEQNNNGKKQKGKSFMQTYREINEKEQAEKLRQESEIAAQRAAKEREERENYAARLRQERLELLKLKQGVISEDDIPKEEKVEKHYTTAEKIGNFFYHNKLYIIFISLLAALAIFLIYDIVNTTDPDVSVMIIAVDNEFEYIAKNMEKVLERYCKDYNGDKKVFVRVTYLPVNNEDISYYNQANSTKLVAEFQGVDSIMVIGDYEVCEIMDITEDVFADLSEKFPGDENVSELGYMLNGTSFAEDIGYEELADDLFMAFRAPKTGFGINEEKFRQNYENAVDMWYNYVNGIEINPQGQ